MAGTARMIARIAAATATGSAQVAAALRLAWQSGRLATAGNITLAVAAGVAPVWGVWSTRGLIDSIAAGAPQAEVFGHGAALLASLAVLAVIPLVTTVVAREMQRRIELHMQQQLFAAVNALPELATFESAAFHDRLRLAQVASLSAPAQVMFGGVSLVRSVVSLVGFGGALAVLGPAFAAIAYAAALPMLLNELRLARRRVNLFDSLSQRERRRSFYAELMSDPRAVKETKMFGAGDYLLARMGREYREIARHERALDRKELATQSAWVLPAVGLVAVAVAMCINGARQGRLTAGDVAAVLAALTTIQTTATGLVREIGSGYQSLAKLRHYLSLTAPALDSGGPSPAARPLRRGIELRDVWFRYADDKPWVLAGINLFIPAHRQLAVVGLNGSGKSTLIKIICGLYRPVRGTITWDGIDYRDLDAASLHQRISTVFQDYMEYDLTAADNVGIADVSAMDDLPRIKAAAHMAGIDDMFAAMPAGYATTLSRRFDAMPAEVESAGDTTFLSGGQWQRVAIARAGLRTGSELLILDEPSAALDPAAEAEIHRRLSGIRLRRTSILISHRLNTVRDADHIVLLDKGQLVEFGTHDQLMTSGGRYARLFALQAANYQDRRVGATP